MIHATNVLAVAAVLTALGLPQAERADPRPTLVVTGSATVEAEPDRFVVRLGTTKQAPEAEQAQREVAETMRAAIAAILEAGVPEEQIRTEQLSLHAVYSQSPVDRGGARGPEVVAFRASNSVRVVTDQAATVGRVIDAGTAVGANEIGGISFELQDDTPQRAEALRRAARNARLQAEALAEGANVRLVGVRRVVEGGGQGPAPVMRSFARAEAATPVQPGAIQVGATVEITYGIAPREEDGESGGR